MKNFKMIAVIAALVVIGLLCMAACTTTYTVDFNSNGGIPATYNSKQVTAGGLVEKPVEPKKEGCLFTGWYEGTSTTPWDFEKDKVNKNMTLTAHWKEIVSTHKVTVSWKAYEGATATGKYLIWLQTPLAGGWMMIDSTSVSGDKTSCVFEIEDNLWKGNKFGASVIYSSKGEYVASAQTDEADTVLFDGTKDIVIPELTLISVSSHKANVSWDEFTGGKPADKYLVWLSMYIEETESWLTLGEFMQVVPATQTTYSFELNDTLWKGKKFGAQVHLMSDGEVIAGAHTAVKDIVEFKGTEDITIPKLTLSVE